MTTDGTDPPRDHEATYRLPEIADTLRRAARRFGTPTFVTDLATVAAAATELRAAFPDPWIRQFSVKANDVPAVIAAVTAHGLGANVVSRGEWALARRAGVPDERISLEGIGKTDADLRAAVRGAARGTPLAWLAVESADEARVLVRLARAAGLGRGGRPAIDVLFRLNPDVVPETQRGLAVGAGTAKFGLTETELSALVEETVSAAGGAVVPRGIHVHVGSQLAAVDAWRDAMRRSLALLGLIRGGLARFDTLDIGGGFPVSERGAAGPRPERFARELPALLEAIPVDRRPTRFATEPGRFLVARAGFLVARVLHVRDRGDRAERATRQVILDAGMTELIRPALYGAFHPIVALTSFGRDVSPGAWPGDTTRAGPTTPADAIAPALVEGPICESTDHLGEHPLPPLRRGDLVAILDAGAYAASLGSTFNGRPRPPQIILEPDGSLRPGRSRGRIA